MNTSPLLESIDIRAIRRESRNPARARHKAFLRGFLEGATTLFSVFQIDAGRQACGTPADDARELSSDVEQIAHDFHAVLSKIEPAAKK